MSGNRSSHPPPSTSPFSTAEEIIRSILDENVSPSEISPSGELYRAIERFHSYHRPINSAPRNLVRSHLNRLTPTFTGDTMSSEHNPDTHERFSRESQSHSESSPIYNVPSPVSSLPSLRGTNATRLSNMPMPSPPSRRQAARSRMYDRHRRSPSDWSHNPWHEGTEPWEHNPRRLEPGRQSRLRSMSSRAEMSMSTVENARRQLHDANSELQALLEYTNAPNNSFDPLHHRPSDPAEESSRRTKRRKLDSDRLAAGFSGFQYGKFGQVEPGQLHMEIVSCDGGSYRGGDYSEDGKLYAPENILENDSSVYCTEGSRCNIVLQHQGATSFTLKELVIKAPRSNYTSPVQGGMVFVSMNSDTILNRTAEYEIPSSNSSGSSRPLSQPLMPIVSVRHNEDGSTMTRAQVRARRLYNIGMEDGDNDAHAARIPPEFNVSPPQCGVTIEYSDDGGDALPRPGWRLSQRNGSYESESSDDEGNLDDFHLNGTDYRMRRRRNRSMAQIGDADDFSTSSSTQGSRRSDISVGSDLLAPHAKFFIERNKSKCTMTFDPPVSGRFILLKMWSPNHDPNANIDIQAVVAKGFAGPRYFPSVQLH